MRSGRFYICGIGQGSADHSGRENFYYQGFAVFSYSASRLSEEGLKTPQARALFHHRNVVAALDEGADMPVPFMPPFSEEEARSWLEANKPGLAVTCRSLAGCREWVLSEEAAPTPAGLLSGFTGRDYLKALSGELRAASSGHDGIRRLAGIIGTGVIPDVRKVKEVGSQTEPGRKTLSLLTEKSGGPEMLSRIADHAPELKLTLKGPLPPYSFVSFEAPDHREAAA